jgi:hypothetical protein
MGSLDNGGAGSFLSAVEHQSMRDDAPVRIDRMTVRNPQAVDLARHLSFAVLIEPALLRAVRLELLPDVNAGAEADLWFGPLVQSRNRDGIVLYPEVAELLRTGLKDRQAQQSWRITERLHDYLSPALKLEERLNWLSTGPQDNDREIREQFQSALIALLDDKESGVANWASRALPRLPSVIRGMEEATMLSAASDLRLGRIWTVSEHLQGGQIPDWFADVLPDDFPETELGVEVTSLGLQFDPAPAPNTTRIRVPATDPRIVQLSSANRSQIISVDAKAPSSVSFSFQGDTATLTTLAGLVYTIEPDPVLISRPADGPIASRAYANCNQALIVWQVAEPIKSCLGFAIERTDVEGDSAVLPNYVGFARSNETSPQPSSVWPIQRFWWTDLWPKRGGHFFYTVTPVAGSPGKLTLLTDRARRTGTVSIAAQETSPVAGFFNHEPRNDARRKSPASSGPLPLLRPGGEIRNKLLNLLAEARMSQQSIYAALWILDDPKLIDAIAAMGSRAHILLSRGAVPNDSNARARSALRSKVDLVDRDVPWQAHGTFLITCDSSARPMTVWTGSTTWNSGGLDRQDSNALLIQSPEIAAHYLTHWRLLRQGPGISEMRKRNATAGSFSLRDGSKALIRFAPGSVDLGEVRDRLSTARSAVLFAIGPRSRRSILDDILGLAKRIYVGGVARTPNEGKQVTIYRGGVARVSPLPYGEKTAPRSGDGFPRQPPIGSRLIVIDPFDERPIVIAGSHFLSTKASQSNEEDLVILEGNSDLAVQCAVHIRGLIDHYAFRATASSTAAKRPAQAFSLSVNDGWQKRFMTGEAAREIEFWMGRRTSYQAVSKREPEPPRKASSKRTGKKKPSAAKKTTKKQAPKISSKRAAPKRTRKSAKRAVKKATSTVKKTAKRTRKVAKKRKK